MNAPADPDDEGDCPILEDVSGAAHREYLARVRMTGAPAVIITAHVVMGDYTMSPERAVDELTIDEARELHAALGDALAAYEVRALTELDTEPEPMIPDIITEESTR
jgi:hypothetical protein